MGEAYMKVARWKLTRVKSRAFARRHTENDSKSGDNSAANPNR
jgi:hypothetical protein